MTPEQQQALQEHIQAIAKILYNDTPPEQLTNLAGIEQAVQSQMQKHVMPEVGFFLSQLPQAQAQATDGDFNCILGELPLTSGQAQQLEVRGHSQLSPCLEAYCLRMSANVSYQRAAEDVEYFAGMPVPRSVQQRLVHRQDFCLPEIESMVEELSIDGGNIRIRTPVGERCAWKGYKAVCLHEQGAAAASFQKNAVVIDWVNAQPLAAVLTCIGDGHDGIWNIAAELGV